MTIEELIIKSGIIAVKVNDTVKYVGELKDFEYFIKLIKEHQNETV